MSDNGIIGDQFSIKGKVCVVTGAGKGIGKEVARLFYINGAKLSLITKNMDDLLDLKKEMEFNDDEVLLYEGDVSEEETVMAFVGDTLKKFKSIDILINNAGIRFRKPFLDISTCEWNNVINVNLNSIFLLCREAGRHMVQQRRGNIINLSSIIGTLGLPELSAYGASKGGIITLTKCLALEWAKYNINVNAIAPGFCETSYTEQFKKKTELYKFTIERTPQRKWGTSLDVANACLYLSTDASKYITGETLNLDGGWSAW
ncbi:MAG: SDR family oxidoreductase [Candidatus Brocadiaceae bacterium]|nr:SDR family oxidoreductase [Candidatus Brocadiaceae bacterium]